MDAPEKPSLVFWLQGKTSAQTTAVPGVPYVLALALALWLRGRTPFSSQHNRRSHAASEVSEMWHGSRTGFLNAHTLGEEDACA